MRKFEHPDVQKPKTSKSTKKQDVVSALIHADFFLLPLLRSRRAVFVCGLVERTDILLQKAQHGLETAS